MIGDKFNAEEFHQFIKPQGGVAFEKTVRVAAVSDTVNDFTAFVVALYHLLYGGNVVLQIGVYGYVNIGIGIIQSCEQRFLVPKIAGEGNAFDTR